MKSTAIHPFSSSTAARERRLGPAQLLPRHTFMATSGSAQAASMSAPAYETAAAEPVPMTHGSHLSHRPAVREVPRDLDSVPSSHLSNNGSDTAYLDRILVRKARRMVIVRTSEIQLIRAAGNYVKIITEDTSHLLRSPLSEIATQLDPARFLRVHRSAIINTECLQAVETNPAGDYFLRLSGDRRLKCSRSYRADLRAFLQGLG